MSDNGIDSDTNTDTSENGLFKNIFKQSTTFQYYHPTAARNYEPTEITPKIYIYSKLQVKQVNLKTFKDNFFHESAHSLTSTCKIFPHPHLDHTFSIHTQIY